MCEKRLAEDRMCIKACDAACVFVSKEVCVSVVVVRQRERAGRGAGLSSCALSIIHDLTLGITEEGKVDRSEREETARQR